MAHDENCRHWLGSLSEYVDATLEEELCKEIELHLAECEDCRVVIDTLRKTVDLVHATSTDPEIPTDVRERLYKRLNLEEFIGRRTGDTCPRCHEGRLDFDGLLNLACSQCGYSLNSGGMSTR